MTEWLLSDEERRRVWFEWEQRGGFNPSPESYDEIEDGHAKAQNQAQLRKVAEKLRDILSSYSSHPESSIWFGHLRKEAGL